MCHMICVIYLKKDNKSVFFKEEEVDFFQINYTVNLILNNYL